MSGDWSGDFAIPDFCGVKREMFGHSRAVARSGIRKSPLLPASLALAVYVTVAPCIAFTPGGSAVAKWIAHGPHSDGERRGLRHRERSCRTLPVRTGSGDKLACVVLRIHSGSEREVIARLLLRGPQPASTRTMFGSTNGSI